MEFMDILSNSLRGAVGPEAAIYALAAVGLNLHFGYTGLLNFGQVGFMLVGAYGAAISVQTWSLPLWVGVLVGLACAVVLAIILGIPTLRLRGDYLAITTIAAAEVLRYLYRSSYAEPLTGGVYGLDQFAGDFFALNPFTESVSLGPFAFSARNLWVMSVTWGMVALFSLLVFLLMRSPWGRVLKAVREDELAARSLGKNVYAYKMQSLILGGVLGALAGVMLAVHGQLAHPDIYMPAVTFYLWAIVILGGASRIMGPIVGAVIFWFLISFLDALLRQATTMGYIPASILAPSEVSAMRFVFVGLLLVLLMAFRPAGILGNREELRLSVR